MFLHIPHFQIYQVFHLDPHQKNLPFCTPKPSKIVSPTFKNWLCFFHGLFSGFLIDFGSILGGFWSPLGRLWGTKIRKKNEEMR